jgi:hypothetical protein
VKRSPYDELQKLGHELDAAQADAAALVHGLDAARGAWRREPGTWSIAECFDHLATANRVYLRVMQPAADRARERGRLRRGPALPGVLGRLFIKWMEPPVRPRMRGKAPRLIRPREQPPLENAYADFLQQQDQVRAFIDANSDIDLAGVTFPNPFIGGLRWSLATGLHVITSHERRHLWQAWNVRRAMEGAAGA